MARPRFPWKLTLEREVELRRRANAAGLGDLLVELDHARGLANTFARTLDQRREPSRRPSNASLRLVR